MGKVIRDQSSNLQEGKDIYGVLKIEWIRHKKCLTFGAPLRDLASGVWRLKRHTKHVLSGLLTSFR
jgi:hypothetical protein